MEQVRHIQLLTKSTLPQTFDRMPNLAPLKFQLSSTCDNYVGLPPPTTPAVAAATFLLLLLLVYY